MSCSFDKTVKGSERKWNLWVVWSTRNYRCLRVLEGHDSRVSGVDILTNKIGVVSCSHDKTWKLWSYSEMSCVCFNISLSTIQESNFHQERDTRKTRPPKRHVRVEGNE